jgi:acyl carrier protein
MSMSNEDLYNQIVDYLVTAFAVPRESIQLDSDLQKNLDLDSIDAVDLMVKLQELTGRKVSPEQFESVRTVQDVIDLVGQLETSA